MEMIPIYEVKKELRSAELSDEAIEELLQVLSIKSLTKLEGPSSVALVEANYSCRGREHCLGLINRVREIRRGAV
ncbi:hypothetical protein CsSME_00011009 [Camellia sinensis var. sinensis]